MLSLFRKPARKDDTKAAKSERTKQGNSTTSTTSDAFTASARNGLVWGGHLIQLGFKVTDSG